MFKKNDPKLDFSDFYKNKSVAKKLDIALNFRRRRLNDTAIAGGLVAAAVAIVFFIYIYTDRTATHPSRYPDYVPPQSEGGV